MTIQTKDLIKNQEINISEETWSTLNKEYDKNTIKQMISDAIQNYDIPMPLRTITKEEAIDDFNNLCNLDSSSLIKEGKFVSRYSYKYKFSNKYIDISNIGSRSSDYFHQKNRFMCDSINAPSPYRTWTQEKFRLTLLNALWTLKVKSINTNTMRSIIGLRKYIASQFRPSAAKAIYEYFNAKNVMDTSAGWGDRLTAFFSSKCTSYYFGTDPNYNLFEGYTSQVELLNSLSEKEIYIKPDPIEELDVKEENFYDLMFTSPPYFNIERYTQDDLQSWKRYRKLQDWLEKFMYVLLDKSYKALKPKGYMIINISDVYSNHTINRICDPMNDYIKQLGGNYVGCWGLRMHKRPNSKAEQKGIFCEPIWIWRKP